MESEDGTGGRHPLLGDVDCHPPIPLVFKADNFSYLLFHFPFRLTDHSFAL